MNATTLKALVTSSSYTYNHVMSYLLDASLSQYFTGLECGHKFCMQCWGDYLTTKIIEEGMGQVPTKICFSVQIAVHSLSFSSCLTSDLSSLLPSQTISCPAHSCDILVDDNTVM